MAMNFGVGGANKEVDSLHFGANGVVYEVSEGYIGVGGVNKEFWAATAAPQSIPVTITGKGDSNYCYATIDGTKHTKAVSGIEVTTGESVITFGIYGSNAAKQGYLTIDGEEVASAGGTSSERKTYDWAVSLGTKTVTIALTYSQFNYGRIDVTTT